MERFPFPLVVGCLGHCYRRADSTQLLILHAGHPGAGLVASDLRPEHHIAIIPFPADTHKKGVKDLCFTHVVFIILSTSRPHSYVRCMIRWLGLSLLTSFAGARTKRHTGYYTPKGPHQHPQSQDQSLQTALLSAESFKSHDSFPSKLMAFTLLLKPHNLASQTSYLLEEINAKTVS